MPAGPERPRASEGVCAIFSSTLVVETAARQSSGPWLTKATGRSSPVGTVCDTEILHLGGFSG